MDTWPLPNINEMLKEVGAGEVFSTLDVRQGFFHIEMREVDIPKIAFVTKSGQYELLVMRFGFFNGPPTNQRVLGNIFSRVTYHNSCHSLFFCFNLSILVCN